ncbi:hypothetical protein [Anaeromyxobacter paludicola]|uniref:Uncharacterized protein n=1 Tax=Anaeromyxobacter paludicola TaxID=2918171 RepID=A0ABM7XBL3_9BACT|nr:hypothetical protein [Anaeromyxobacter paludicola]BDG09245.1 hypothetical protein AMPC_23580 [Anaeromyxobacter paludicola]
MTHAGTRAAAAAFTLLLSGAARAAGMAGHLQSCTSRSGATCSEWDVMSAGPQLQPRLESACKYSRGKLAMAPCPQKKRVGTCTYPAGQGVPGSKLFFYPPTTLDKARQTCAQEKGIFAER